MWLKGELGVSTQRGVRGGEWEPAPMPWVAPMTRTCLPRRFISLFSFLQRLMYRFWGKMRLDIMPILDWQCRGRRIFPKCRSSFGQSMTGTFIYVLHHRVYLIGEHCRYPQMRLTERRYLVDMNVFPNYHLLPTCLYEYLTSHPPPPWCSQPTPGYCPPSSQLHHTSSRQPIRQGQRWLQW